MTMYSYSCYLWGMSAKSVSVKFWIFEYLNFYIFCEIQIREFVFFMFHRSSETATRMWQLCSALSSHITASTYRCSMQGFTEQIQNWRNRGYSCHDAGVGSIPNVAPNWTSAIICHREWVLHQFIAEQLRHHQLTMPRTLWKEKLYIINRRVLSLTLILDSRREIGYPFMRRMLRSSYLIRERTIKSLKKARKISILRTRGLLTVRLSMVLFSRESTVLFSMEN